MRLSIFLAVATLFLAVCAPSIGYSNTGPQTDGSQPGTTKFTVGIIYHTDVQHFVPKIKECVKGTNWNVITAVADPEQSETEIPRVFKNSNIVILATHGRYKDGKHDIKFGTEWIDAAKYFKEKITLKQNAIVFAAACETMAGNNNEGTADSTLANIIAQACETGTGTSANVNEYTADLTLANIFKEKGAVAYIGYQKKVVTQAALVSCEDLLMGLVAGKTIKEALDAFRWERDLNPCIEDENIKFNLDYRIPRCYFGFMQGREAMTAMWERNDKAYAAALMQMKADLESCKSDSESGVLYVESFKKGVRAVLLENGAPEDKVDGTVDLLMGTFGLTLLKKEKK